MCEANLDLSRLAFLFDVMHSVKTLAPAHGMGPDTGISSVRPV